MEALKAEYICKTFGGLHALDRVYLNVSVGECRAIIGPNGAGKSTLLNVISGALLADSGAIHLYGKDISTFSQHSRARLGLSRTFQLINLLLNLSVLENVILALRSFQRLKSNFYRPLSHYKGIFSEARQILGEWGLFGKQREKVCNLSYGEQRLLDVALAVASDPRLLLLDEPMSGLTQAEMHALNSRLNILKQDISIIFVEHNIDIALSLADRITVLHLGRVIAEGTKAEIEKNQDVERIYLGTG